MKPKSIEKLIVKYITNSISRSELDELDILLQNPANKKQFWDFVKLNYFSDFIMMEYNTGESKKLLLSKIRKDKNFFNKNRFRKVFKYAAIAIFFLGSGYFIKQALDNTSLEKTVVPKENFITLELENGNIKVISEDGSSIIKDSKGDIVGNQIGNQIAYSKESQINKLTYNTLKVPYGKQFRLELSDSTIVHLNSGSVFKYPVKFLEGKVREVFLTGEAYLEVAKDKERPFIITSDNLNIKVLGTKFNVSAYPEDRIKEVVLVEGSVELYDENIQGDNTGTTILMPGMKGNFDSLLKNITSDQVITDVYTSWVDGELVFRNMTFSEILKKLERRYDVTIINENTKLSDVEFNASFGEMPVSQIMEYFERVYGIKFQVDHNKIIIN